MWRHMEFWSECLWHVGCECHWAEIYINPYDKDMAGKNSIQLRWCFRAISRKFSRFFQWLYFKKLEIFVSYIFCSHSVLNGYSLSNQALKKLSASNLATQFGPFSSPSEGGWDISWAMSSLSDPVDNAVPWCNICNTQIVPVYKEPIWQ